MTKQIAERGPVFDDVGRPRRARADPMSERLLRGQLEEMGFSSALSERALAEGHNTLQGALDWLMAAATPRKCAHARPCSRTRLPDRRTRARHLTRRPRYAAR